MQSTFAFLRCSSPLTLNVMTTVRSDCLLIAAFVNNLHESQTAGVGIAATVENVPTPK